MVKIKLNKKKIWLIICFFIIIILALITLLLINNNNKKQNKETEKMMLSFEDRINTIHEFDSKGFYVLGWLQVQGTNIDVPIVSTIGKDVSEIDYSYGWQSPMYETGENREVLLGHNVVNVSSTPMLSNENLVDFEALMSFSYAGFAKDNLYIQYTKNGKNELYAIYAIGFYDYGYDDAGGIKGSDELKKHIKNVRKNSIYDYDIDVNENDTIISVKTCTRYFGLNEKQQFIIDARKVRDDEEIIKYSVSTNKLFDKLITTKEES